MAQPKCMLALLLYRKHNSNDEIVNGKIYDFAHFIFVILCYLYIYICVCI